MGQALLVQGLRRSLVLNGEADKHRMLLHASDDRILVDDEPTSTLLFSARDGSATHFQLRISGKLQRIYEGTLEITASHGELFAVVSMERETAVATIVASEMPADAPIEALKAQAVVTRSFLSAGSRHREFDFCDTTHCQYLRSPDEISSRVNAAVQATDGLVLNWHRHVIAAMYSSRCGGQTRSLQESGMRPGDGYPYYPAVCAWCRKHPTTWETRLPAGALPPEPASESSRIARARQWGWGALPGSQFSVKQDADGTLIRGHSIGHGLGLCQFGAAGMAVEGADFRSILAHYYPNSQLAKMPL